MKQYNISGMSCAACVAHVEKAAKGVDGVTSCSVNLLTNSMIAEGSFSDAELISAIEAAGYGASPKTDESLDSSAETAKIAKRLVLSVIFLALLMFVSMGSMHIKAIDDAIKSLTSSMRISHHIFIGVFEFITAGIVLIINRKFFISGAKSALKLAPNMDTLVAMGSGVSFLYSCVLLVRVCFFGGGMEDVHGMYFESAAMIVTLITVGKLLEAISKGKTTNAIKSLMKLSPQTATVEEDGVETNVPVSSVKVGDIFVVYPGTNIPVDGEIISGETSVNEAALTGESIPADKKTGDEISAGTINLTGFVRAKATRVGRDTTLSGIIRLVEEAASTKAPIAKLADTVASYFVPSVIAIALFTAVVWLLCGESVPFALERAISVLVISCPCALGLATPVAIMVASGKGAQNGIMFKTATSLEQAGKTDICVLDKTGTVTAGVPKVTDVIPADDITEEELLTLAYSLEIKSEHPLAYAINEHCKDRFTPFEITGFSAVSGSGVCAEYEGKKLFGGSYGYILEKADIPGRLIKFSADLSDSGKTPLFFASEEKIYGLIAVEDEIRSESVSAIRELKKMGIAIVMLTGDNERTASSIGRRIKADKIISGVMPAQKESIIRKLKEYGRVAMVGDGINDAPALTSADIGIAIGAGTDIAIDAADVVLMKSELSDVPASIRLSRATLKNIKENLFWAFIYNVIGIPIAAGLFIPIMGLRLSPVFGAAAMSLSSFCVVTNALRLNLIKIYSSAKDCSVKKLTIPFDEIKPDELTNEKENKTDMKEVLLTIEGMMCGHCEATVKKALESVEGVKEAAVSHEKGTAEVKCEDFVDMTSLKKAVEDKDYKVTDIK